MLEDANAFIDGIEAEGCIPMASVIGTPEGVNWRYDKDYAIDNEQGIKVVFDTPEDYEISLDKIHIDAQTAE